VENQKTIGNVKQTRPSLIDLLFQNKKAKLDTKTDIKTSQDVSDTTDGIPDFFRR
jgi:hypothetical protein